MVLAFYDFIGETLDAGKLEKPVKVVNKFGIELYQFLLGIGISVAIISLLIGILVMVTGKRESINQGKTRIITVLAILFFLGCFLSVLGLIYQIRI